MTDLGTLGGTLAGSTFVSGLGFQGALNSKGQVVGGSNLEGDLIAHPYLWTSPGPMQDLGTLGGDCGTAMAINDAGVVVGAANFKPGSCNLDAGPFRAFIWTQNGGIKDLGRLNGDGCGQPNAINSAGQIVGVSMSCDNPRKSAVLWEEGQVVDLNSLIPPGSPLHLTKAFAINDGGEIAGVGVPSGCSMGDVNCGHAFVLIPICEDGTEGCADAPLNPSLAQTEEPLAESTAASANSQQLTAAEIMSRYRTASARRSLRGRLVSPEN